MDKTNCVLKEDNFINSRGFKLYTKHYIPKDKTKTKALVFLVYGYSDHVNTYKNVIKSTYLCEKIMQFLHLIIKATEKVKD